ncbi:MAG: hypothetical protein JWN26_713 [Candidatus Saccharibacteria bacterium]|nr:hypothetical protein [Candidatus Saccharibacteria bacterium]
MPITQIQFWVSGALTALFVLLASKIYIKKDYLVLSGIIFALTAVVITASLIVSSFFTDLSYDGQGYHQATIAALDKGWNPLTQNIDGLKGFKSENKLWIDAYPNANDIVVNNIYKVTGNVEMGKAITFILILISWILGFIALLKLKVSKWLAALLITIAVFNPVNVMQIFTFGLDSQFYSLMLILFSLGVLMYMRTHRYITYAGIFITTIMIINNKLTSIAYLGVFIGFICLVILWKKKYKLFFQACGLFLASIVVGVLLFGYHPYVTNYENHKSVLYPIYVNAQVDSVAYDFSENRPSNYVHDNQLDLFVRSIFFEPNGNFSAPQDAAKMRVPFIFSQSELNSFIYLGPKEGGFGVLFSGIITLLVLMAGLMIFLRKTIQANWRDIVIAVAGLAIVLITCIINPLNNVARYIPQLWLIIPIMLWIAWRFKHTAITVLSVLILAIAFINTAMIFNKDFNFNASSAAELSGYLHKLADETKNAPIKVNFSQSEGNQFLLNYYNVKYVEDTGSSVDFTCSGKLVKKRLLDNIGNSTAVMCVDTTMVKNLGL